MRGGGAMSARSLHEVTCLCIAEPYPPGMQAVLTNEAFAFIPEPIRRKLGLKPGTVLDFDEQAPFLKAVPAFNIDDMMACIGAGQGGYQGKTSVEWLEDARGTVELPSEE
jgi:glucokinase